MYALRIATVYETQSSVPSLLTVTVCLNVLNSNKLEFQYSTLHFFSLCSKLLVSMCLDLYVNSAPGGSGTWLITLVPAVWCSNNQMYIGRSWCVSICYSGGSRCFEGIPKGHAWVLKYEDQYKKEHENAWLSADRPQRIWRRFLYLNEAV